MKSWLKLMTVGFIVLVPCTIASAASLDVTTSAAFTGTYGLEITLTPGSGQNALVQTNTPNAETVVRATFKIRPRPASGDNDLGMPTAGSRFEILRAKKIGGAEAFRVMFYKSWTTSDFFIFLIAFEDDNSATFNSGGGVPIFFANNPAQVTVEYQTASSPGANDGFARLYQGAVLKGEITGLDNDQRVVDFFDMGVFNQQYNGGPMTDMDMVMDFDDFESYRTLLP